jgi:hypothetical protein
MRSETMPEIRVSISDIGSVTNWTAFVKALEETDLKVTKIQVYDEQCTEYKIRIDYLSEEADASQKQAEYKRIRHEVIEPLVAKFAMKISRITQPS